MIKKLKELCGPIQLVLIYYLLEYIIFFYIWIFGEDNNINNRIIEDTKNYYLWDILIAIIWIIILYYLCKNNYKTAAWLITLIPIIFILFFAGIYFVLGEDNKNGIQGGNITNNLGRLCYSNCKTCDGPSRLDCTSCKDGSQITDEDNDGAGYC